METPMPFPAEETAALRDAYAALNRADVAGFVAAFDPQIVRIEPSDSPQGGTYRGLEAVRAHVAKGRGSWAEGGCEPQRFIVAPSPPGGGDRIIVLVHVRVRLKHETQWREGQATDVYTFRDGKVIEFRTFFDEALAFEWAGIKASDAN